MVNLNTNKHTLVILIAFERRLFVVRNIRGNLDGLFNNHRLIRGIDSYYNRQTISFSNVFDKSARLNTLTRSDA